MFGLVIGARNLERCCPTVLHRSPIDCHPRFCHARTKAYKNRAEVTRQGRVYIPQRFGKEREGTRVAWCRQEANYRSTNWSCWPAREQVLWWWPKLSFGTTTVIVRREAMVAASKRQNETTAKSAEGKNCDKNEEDASSKLAGEEVEVKLRIPDSASFAALKKALLPCFQAMHEQENFFFDGANKELSSARVVLRVRLYDGDSKAVITCKGKQVLKDGVGRAPEEEEEVDPALARKFIDSPDLLLEHESELILKLRKDFKLVKGLVLLGGFNNLRNVYKWKGHTLEVDLTSYPWGSMFELECETDSPESLKKEIEDLLETHNIPFSDSKKSKFANFMDKTLE